MKWFHHECAARYDTKLQSLGEECGAEGIGAYWMLLEEIGTRSDTFHLMVTGASADADRAFARILQSGKGLAGCHAAPAAVDVPRTSLKSLARTLYVTEGLLLRIIEKSVEAGLFDSVRWQTYRLLYSPSFEQRADHYTKRRRRAAECDRTTIGTSGANSRLLSAPAMGDARLLPVHRTAESRPHVDAGRGDPVATPELLAPDATERSDRFTTEDRAEFDQRAGSVGPDSDGGSGSDQPESGQRWGQVRPALYQGQQTVRPGLSRIPRNAGPESEQCPDDDPPGLEPCSHNVSPDLEHNAHILRHDVDQYPHALPPGFEQCAHNVRPDAGHSSHNIRTCSVQCSRNVRSDAARCRHNVRTESAQCSYDVRPDVAQCSHDVRSNSEGSPFIDVHMSETSLQRDSMSANKVPVEQTTEQTEKEKAERGADVEAEAKAEADADAETDVEAETETEAEESKKAKKSQKRRKAVKNVLFCNVPAKLEMPEALACGDPVTWDGEVVLTPSTEQFEAVCSRVRLILKDWNEYGGSEVSWTPTFEELRKLFFGGDPRHKLWLCRQAFSLNGRTLDYPRLVLRAIRLMLEASKKQRIQNPFGWVWSSLHGTPEGLPPWAHLPSALEESRRTGSPTPPDPAIADTI